MRIPFDHNTTPGTRHGLPVTVNFENQVPWQAIVNVLDICTRLKITNFAPNMMEIQQ